MVSPRNMHPQGSEDEPQSCLAAPDRLCVLSPFCTNDVCRSILATPWCFGVNHCQKHSIPSCNFQANLPFFEHVLFKSSPREQHLFEILPPGYLSAKVPWPIHAATAGGRLSGCRDVIEMSPNSRVVWRFLRHLETLRNIPCTLYTMFQNMLMYEFGCASILYTMGHSAICFVYLIHLKILDMFSTHLTDPKPRLRCLLALRFRLFNFQAPRFGWTCVYSTIATNTGT